MLAINHIELAISDILPGPWFSGAVLGVSTERVFLCLVRHFNEEVHNRLDFYLLQVVDVELRWRSEQLIRRNREDLVNPKNVRVGTLGPVALVHFHGSLIVNTLLVKAHGNVCKTRSHTSVFKWNWLRFFSQEGLPGSNRS